MLKRQHKVRFEVAKIRMTGFMTKLCLLIHLGNPALMQR